MDSTQSKQSPFGQYEWVTVTFTEAHMDVVIPYTRLKPDVAADVRWLDVAQKSLGTVPPQLTDAELGSYEVVVDPQIPTIYRAMTDDAKPFGSGYVILRSTMANYTTRLLLFVERNEG